MSLLDRVRQELGKDFEVEREIGRGGMGAVFLARDRALDLAVAIKVLLPEQASGRTLERFRREAQFLARFDHPHIVRALRAGTTPGGLDFLVMPYLAGQTLRDHLDASGRLPSRTAVRYATELLDALGAIHARGLVHRDVKPSNIVLANDAVRLTDFGIVHDDAEAADPLTQPDRQPGSRGYMAPEQREGSIDPRTDLYAAALVTYEMLTGSRWEPRAGWAGVPRRVAAVVRRGLLDEPARRWPDAATFAHALRRNMAWRRRGIAAAALVAAVVLWMILAPDGQAQPTLAVLPFRASADVGELGEQVARLSALELEGHVARGGPPLADWGRAVAWWSRSGGPEPLPDAAWNALGADHALHGTIETAGDSIVVRPVLSSPGGAHVALGRFAAARDRRFDLSCQVAFAAVMQLRESSVGQWRCSYQDRDEHAIDALAAGEWAFEREMWALADQEYSRALSIDSTLALAWWRLYNTRRWRRLPSGIDLPRVQARWGDQLGTMDSLLVAADITPWPARLGLLEQAVARFPAHGQPRLLLGNELFHRGALVGIGLDSALAVLEGAIAVNPALAPALSTAAWAALRWDDSARSRDLLARYRLLASQTTDDGFCLGCLLELAWSARFTPGADREVRALLADADGVSSLNRGLRWGLSTGVPDAQRAVGDLLAARPGASPVDRAEARLGASIATMALGRPHDAVAMLDAAVSGAPPPYDRELALVAAEWRVVLWRLHLPGGDSAHAAAAEARLRRWLDDPAWRDDPRRRRVEWIVGAFEAPPTVPAADTAPLVSPFMRAASHLRWAAQQPPRDALRWWRWYENSDVDGWPEGGLHAAEVDWAFESWARLQGGLAARAAGMPVLACRLLRDVPRRWARAEPAVLAWRREAEQALEGCDD